MELLESVDGVLVTWSILVPHLVPSLLPAIAASITIRVVAIAVRSITFMRCRLERVGIGLHDVKLRTPLTIDLVGITVITAAVASRWIAVLILGWHQDEIEGSVATAT